MEPKYELEEGEAGYHGLDDADDTSIDPDIALSYLVRVLFNPCSSVFVLRLRIWIVLM